MSKQVITINRTYGSNGRLIGKALSERLNIPFYDKELIELVSQECNIPAKELEKVDEKRANQWHLPLKEAMHIVLFLTPHMAEQISWLIHHHSESH